MSTLTLSSRARSLLEIALANGAVSMEVADSIDRAQNPEIALITALGALAAVGRVGGTKAQHTLLALAGTSLHQEWLGVFDKDGLVVFWFDVSGTGTQPTVPNASRYVRVSGILSTDSNAVVANKLAQAISADASFEASSYRNIVSVNDKFYGVRPAPLPGTSGFSIMQIQSGQNQAADASTTEARLVAIQTKVDEIAAKLAVFAPAV